MQITIDIEAQYLDAIRAALASFHGVRTVTDEKVAEYIAQDLNRRYEEIHDNIGFEDEVAMFLDEWGDEDFLNEDEE